VTLSVPGSGNIREWLAGRPSPGQGPVACQPFPRQDATSRRRPLVDQEIDLVLARAWGEFVIGCRENYA
jgi:hypothetical protein